MKYGQINILSVFVHILKKERRKWDSRTVRAMVGYGEDFKEENILFSKMNIVEVKRDCNCKHMRKGSS